MAHRIALSLNAAQDNYFRRAAGTARFAYNWALERWNRRYAEHLADPTLPRPSYMSVRKELNAVKRTEYPWMMQVTKCAPDEAVRNLGDAFQNWFNSISGKRKGPKVKAPQVKKKGRHDKFKLTSGTFTVEDQRIRVPKLGWVRMREPLRFTGKLISATFSKTADRWFVSITVDTEDGPRRPAENQGVAGVDLGISNLLTLSTGEVIPGRKPQKGLLPRLRRLARSLSRKTPKSNNRKKAKAKLARVNARIANIRQDEMHKLTTDLSRRFHTLVIEDLNVKGMVKNRHLSRALSDMAFGEFRRQLTYKVAMRGGQLIVADRWYPSSKLCSSCGHQLAALPLSARNWTCPVCGVHHDRDVNAAINLEKLAAGAVVTAYGAGSSDAGSNAGVKLPAAK